MAGGAWPSVASVGVFSTVEPCAPTPFGSTDGEPKDTLGGAELVSTGVERNDERNHGFCADAEAGTDADGDGDGDADAESGTSGDGLAAGGRLGIGVVALGTFVFPGTEAGAGVAPGAAATLGLDFSIRAAVRLIRGVDRRQTRCHLRRSAG